MSNFIRDMLGIGDDPVSNGVYSYYAMKYVEKFLPDKRRDLEDENLRLRNEGLRREYDISEEDASLDTALLGGASFALGLASKQGLPGPKGAMNFAGHGMSDLSLRMPHGPGPRVNLIPTAREFSIAAKPSFANALAKGIRTASRL